MALMALTSRLSSYRLLMQRSVAASRQAPMMFASALSRVATKAKAPLVPEPVDGEYDEYGDFDGMADLPAAQKRRVLALKEVQAKYDEINKDYQKEVAQLQATYQERFAPLFDERKSIVSGNQAVAAFDVPDDEEPDSPIKDFWLAAFQNHDKISPYISERDSEVLAYLEDVRSEVLTGEERGFKLTYHFAENPFFTNKVLNKTYVLMPEDDIVPKEFIGCKIAWKAGKDVTVEQVKKRVKGGRDDKKSKAFVTETVPCDSFFNTFDPPTIPSENSAMSDEALDELQEELTIDFDIGFAVKDNIIPRAVEWFTGEIAPYPEDGDEYYDEEDEEPAAALPPPPPSKRR